MASCDVSTPSRLHYRHSLRRYPHHRRFHIFSCAMEEGLARCRLSRRITLAPKNDGPIYGLMLMRGGSRVPLGRLLIASMRQPRSHRGGPTSSQPSWQLPRYCPLSFLRPVNWCLRFGRKRRPGRSRPSCRSYTASCSVNALLAEVRHESKDWIDHFSSVTNFGYKALRCRRPL